MSITILNKYNFEGPFSSTFQLKNISGVYIIYGNNDNGKSWTRIDVGESGNVRERIESHDRKPCWEERGYNYLAVAVLYVNESERMRIEKEIRAEKQLPCGQQ